VRFVDAPAHIARSGAGYAVVMLLNARPGTGADIACAQQRIASAIASGSD
jgi:hypothetical protein